MEGLRLSHELEHNVLAFDGQRQLHLLASITAPEARDDVNDDQRSPVDLVAVLDRSGSMAGAKLQSVKDTTKFLVQQLSSQDRLSVVTFQSDVDVNFALREMTDEGKAAAELAIDRIKASGGTNLSGGLFKGIDQHQQAAGQGAPSSSSNGDSDANAAASGEASARAATRPNRIRTVFLFTDGQATTGVTNSARLKGILNLMLDHAVRPTIHCFGFGQNYDAECLEAVAEAGQGQSAFIEDAESTPAALATALGGIMSIVAQNAEVVFTPKAGVAIRDIDTAFRVTNNNGVFTVTLGDLFAEEKKDLLVKLQVNTLEEPQDSQDLVQVQVRYLDLLVGGMKQSEVAVSLGRPAEAAADAAVQPQVQEAMLRLGTAKAMKDAVNLGDRGDLPGARDLLQRQLDKLPAESTSPVITALREDLQQLLSGYQTHTTYMSSRHHGLSMSSSHRSQRHTSHVSTGPATVNPYASRTQQDYSRRATTSVRASASNAQPQAQPTNASMPAPSSRSDPAALFAAAQLAAVSRHARREPSASLPRVSSTNASLDWLAGVQQGRHDSSAADAGHRRTGPESVLTGRRQTSDRASLQRAPSNVSAAGTEMYDPVTDGGYIDDLEEYADPDSSVPSRHPAPASDPSPSLTFPSAPHVSSGTPVPVTEMLRSASLSPGPEGADDEA